MAEIATSSSLKRQREEDQEQEQETFISKEETKRQKPSPSSSSYEQVLCLLDHDLTSLITTLQQETSSEEQNATVLKNPTLSSSSSSSSSSSCSSPSLSQENEYESDNEKVMKHLLEASDDELGLPNNNTKISGSNYDEMIKSERTNQDYYVNEFSLLDGFSDVLWELEDEAANYYTLLQSELFM